MDAAKVQLVQQSFGRCLVNRALKKPFLDAFYVEFLASDPRIKPMFLKTDMRKQQDLLQQGLVTLIMFSNGAGLARLSIERLAVKHNRSHVNVKPEMYRLWTKSLLKCVKEYDPDFDVALQNTWMEVLDPGIELMKHAY